jgi:hypothetical protein
MQNGENQIKNSDSGDVYDDASSSFYCEAFAVLYHGNNDDGMRITSEVKSIRAQVLHVVF